MGDHPEISSRIPGKKRPGFGLCCVFSESGNLEYLGKANAGTYMVPHAPGDSPIWDEESTLWNARSGEGRVNVNSSRLCIVTQRESGSDLGFFVNHHSEPVLPCSRPSHWGDTFRT